MKKILSYTTHNFDNEDNITGGTLRLLELLKGLSKKGYKIDLISPTNDYFNNCKNINNYKSKNYEINTFLVPNNLINLLFNFWIFIKNITLNNHNCSIAFDLPNASILTLFGAKNINLFLRQDIIGYRKNYCDNLIIKKIYFSVIKLIENIIFLRAKKIFVQCKYDKNIIIKRHKNLELDNKIIIINNNLNVSWIKKNRHLINKKKTNSSRKNNRLVLIFVGAISKRKGIDILLKAYKYLINCGYYVDLKIIGNGDIKMINNYLEKYNNIYYMGFIKNPLKEIAKSDLMIVPSREDSFPNTVMESMYLEVPVIGSKAGGIPEQLEYDKLLFENKPRCLFKKIEKVIKNNNLSKYKKLIIKRKKYFLFNWVEEIEKNIFW